MRHVPRANVKSSLFLIMSQINYITHQYTYTTQNYTNTTQLTTQNKSWRGSANSDCSFSCFFPCFYFEVAGGIVKANRTKHDNNVVMYKKKISAPFSVGEGHCMTMRGPTQASGV